MTKRLTGVSQKIIILNKEGKILALKRGMTAPSRPGYWDLPGGELEYGEDPRGGIIRETLEESGIKIKITDPELIDVLSGINNLNECWVTICYVSKVGDVAVKLSFEHTEYKWISPIDFLKLQVSPKSIKFVETFISK